MADRKVYWDACVWIGLINGEADKVTSCQFVIAQAEQGQIDIWTSTLSLAEVFKKKCAGDQIAIAEASDEAFENFLSQDYVIRAQVDADVGRLARRLLRTYPILAKPADAIHLATALLNNVDEFHTFDGDNLLGLNNMIARADGVLLRICKPPEPPDPNAGTLFEGVANAEGQQGAA